MGLLFVWLDVFTGTLPFSMIAMLRGTINQRLGRIFARSLMQNLLMIQMGVGQFISIVIRANKATSLTIQEKQAVLRTYFWVKDIHFSTSKRAKVI
jgi:hypothetical protein